MGIATYNRRLTGQEIRDPLSTDGTATNASDAFKLESIFREFSEASTIGQLASRFCRWYRMVAPRDSIGVPAEFSTPDRRLPQAPP